MGACESSASATKTKVVPSLGMNHKGKPMKPLGHDEVKTRGLSFGGHEDHHPRKHEVACPDGHVMRAHIAREMFIACRAAEVCDKCDGDIDREGALYECMECPERYTLCVHCARESLGYHPCKDRGLPVLDIMLGDIFLCGPDPNGIHHVVLARGGLKPVGNEYRNLLDIPPGMELWSCQTIESTQGSVGDQTWWYPTMTIFQRCPGTGEVFLVADHPPDSDEVQAAMEPVPMKILLHPLRGEDEQEEFDHEAFEEVIEESAEESRKYGKLTAVRSFLDGLANLGTLDPESYPTGEDKERLMEKIRQTWDSRPICASVAIKCWQKYFDRICDNDEEAVDRILDVMPHWCNESTPSLMVKTLTQHGWELLDNFDG